MSRAMQLLIREEKTQTQICQTQVWALSTLCLQQNFLPKCQLVIFIRSTYVFKCTWPLGIPCHILQLPPVLIAVYLGFRGREDNVI